MRAHSAYPAMHACEVVRPLEDRVQGFTLLEVMVSIALLGILLISLITSLGYHLSVAESQARSTTATLLAKQKMYELEKNPGSSKGTFDDPFRDFEYETGLKPSAIPGLSVISVQVWTDKDKNVVTMTGLIESVERQ